MIDDTHSDDPTEDETFDRTTSRRFGTRGNPVFDQEQTRTDLETLTERVARTDVPFCTCGAALTPTAAYRCCNCDAIACPQCTIRLHRRHYCPPCIQHDYGLDKPGFIALVFIHHDLVNAADLLHIELMDDNTLQLIIDDAGSVVDPEYLTSDGSLTPRGQEALHAGKQVYGEDSDIQALLHQLRLRQVATRD